MSVNTALLPFNAGPIDLPATGITPGIDSSAERLGFDGDLSQFPEKLDAAPTGTSYMLTDHWGGSWSDAEKSPTNNEDDLMCWAAAAANILEWTGWGNATGMADSDEMFAYLQDHWTDEGSLMEYGWGWWFDGINDSEGWTDWSQVDVPGGGFYLTESFWGVFHKQINDFKALSAIDQYFHSGYGVALGTYGPNGSHSLTCWGYNYDPSNPTDYKGIWVTDSDDDKYTSDPPDELHYYEVVYDSSEWHLQDYHGSNDWYIGTVQALAKAPWSLPGDANSDGTVDQADAKIVSDNWLMQTGASWTTGDFNNDGRVDDIDSTIMGANWQTSFPADISSSVATEQDVKTRVTAPEVLSAAANGDGTEPWALQYDLDHSGKIDLGDLAFFASVYREKPGVTTKNPYSYAADFDRSGTVDMDDLALFADNYHLSQPNNSISDTAEVGQSSLVVRKTDAICFEGDGKVTDNDVAILAQNWMTIVEGMDDDDDEPDAVFAEVSVADEMLGLFDE